MVVLDVHHGDVCRLVRNIVALRKDNLPVAAAEWRTFCRVIYGVAEPLTLLIHDI